MSDSQFSGQSSELWNLQILRLDLNRVRLDLHVRIRQDQRLPDLLNSHLSLPHCLRIKLDIDPHPSNICLERTRNVAEGSMSQEGRDLLRLLTASTMLRIQKDRHVRRRGNLARVHDLDQSW